MCRACWFYFYGLEKQTAVAAYLSSKQLLPFAFTLCLSAVITGSDVHPCRNTSTQTNAGLMLGQRRRRWTNIKPTLAQWPVLAERGSGERYLALLPIFLEKHQRHSILYKVSSVFCLALIGLRRWIVYSRSPATEINCSQFGVKSQFTDLPAVYTSSLPYLTHICEDFLL